MDIINSSKWKNTQLFYPIHTPIDLIKRFVFVFFIDKRKYYA